jgi:GNAT superfamily N-acetyltransferase
MIAGVVAVRYPWLKGSYLELIGLFPDRQGQGLGAAILQWMEQETKPWAMNCWVLVSSFNDAAKRFYLRQGFKEIANIEALVSARSNELLLRKVLRAPV